MQSESNIGTMGSLAATMRNTNIGTSGNLQHTETIGNIGSIANIGSLATGSLGTRNSSLPPLFDK